MSYLLTLYRIRQEQVIDTEAQKVLIVGPVNTIQNWVTEFNLWLPSHPRSFSLHVLNDNTKDLKSRSQVHKRQLLILFCLFVVGYSRLNESRQSTFHLVRDVPMYTQRESTRTRSAGRNRRLLNLSTWK